MKKLAIILLIFSVDIFAQVDGTTGLPVGGIGTGAIKFNAGAGTFSANFRTPTRNGDYQLLGDTQFQLFTKKGSDVVVQQQLKAEVNNGRVNDDAVFPRHFVNFGEINNVTITMTSYIPYAPSSVDLMCHPAALYEFTLTNSSNEIITASVALKLKTDIAPSAIPDNGFFSNSSSLQFCLLGKITNGSGELSYGNDNGFFNTGSCNNLLSSTLNRLALRVELNPSETKTLRFVLAWYRADEVAHYKYTTLWENAGAVAASAMDNFDLFKDNANELVNRMRASNLPLWLEDQTLNSLVNLVNNSVYMQDGRYCHTEGMWTPEGTMDQMWLARQIYTLINPDLAWQELEWWARTQHVISYPGQIHHDVGENFNYVDWDDTEHNDYRDIHKWVDLNCGFIVSVYEAFIATNDLDKLSYFWIYVKNAAQRILDQVDEFGSTEYPYTFIDSESSYDAGGNSQAYNAGLSIVAYKTMTYLAGIMNESETEARYADAMQQAITGFDNRYLDNQYETSNYCESIFGGLWAANFLKFDLGFEKEKLDNLFSTISNFYTPLQSGLGHASGSYSEWAPYLVVHLGGYALQSGRNNIWSALQYDWYQRNYLNRNLVFNQELGIPAKVTNPTYVATSTSADDQYISIPAVWRNYYEIAGYHRNVVSGELWLEPKIFDSNVDQLQNVMIVLPDGYATINYNTYGDSNQNQQIFFKPDQQMEVSTLYVRDLYNEATDQIRVKINGADVNFERTGSGYQTHLKLDWSGTIPVSGIIIDVEGEARPGLSIPDPPANVQGTSESPSEILLTWEKPDGDVNGYSIEINSGSGYQQLAMTTSDDNSYLDNGLLTAHEYTYRIRSYNTQYVSDPSDEINVTTQESGNGAVVVALNVGGDNYTSSEGILYVGDESSGYVTGGTSYSATNAIENTLDDALYQSERYGDFNYRIPLTNKLYNVVLKFAEVYWDNIGSRIFNVTIEGEEVISDFDIYYRAGKYYAYDVVIPVELKDGKMNVNFVTIEDNAKLSALEIRERNVSAVEDDNYLNLPTEFSLSQNYPNPFNPTTVIGYQLPAVSDVSVMIYDILGREITTLVNESQTPGTYKIEFDGAALPSGIYFCKMKAGDFTSTIKLILIK